MLFPLGRYADGSAPGHGVVESCMLVVCVEWCLTDGIGFSEVWIFYVLWRGVSK